MSPGPAADQRCRIYLRFTKMDNLQHSPPVKRSQLPMKSGKPRIRTFLGAPQLILRT